MKGPVLVVIARVSVLRATALNCL
uniref:Uncharacterized protein n=1 Tax=Rhizophora mucronata TaxID=61149 RepID=A0A2P2J296_RHIMU